MHRFARFLVVALFVLVAWFGGRVLYDAGKSPTASSTPTLQVRSTDPSSGPSNAPVTIVEFADFSCPFCRTSALALDAMERAFPDSLRRVWKDFPLAEHAEAEPAARASRCAGTQGKFWEMHNALFARQKELALPLYAALAGSLGLDTAEFTACMGGDDAATLVAQNVQDAVAAHVDGIPYLFINGVAYTGTVSQNALRDAITAALAQGQRE